MEPTTTGAQFAVEARAARGRPSARVAVTPEVYTRELEGERNLLHSALESLKYAVEQRAIRGLLIDNAIEKAARALAHCEPHLQPPPTPPDADAWLQAAREASPASIG